jgi:hypothetical protein
MNETPKNKSGWRWLRRVLITLAVLVTLVAVFYTEEDWRGKRAWENYKHEWEAKGEKFDWQSFVPPSVPDDQNFFTAPIFTNMLNGNVVMNPYTRAAVQMSWPENDEVGYLGGEGKTRITDLKTWQATYRNPTNVYITKEFPIAPQPQTPAKDILSALSKFDSAIEELRQASQRPYSNVPLIYQDGFNSALKLNSYFMAIKQCTQLLKLRANAELADGQSAKALDDVKLLFYLNNSLRTSPFLISHLVRAAIVPYELQPIWEGLAEDKWSDEQLIALDAELGKMDFLADFEYVMRGERAFAIASFENQRHTHEVIMPLENDGVVTNKIPLMPDAYFYQNELAIAQMQQQWVLPLIDTNTRTVLPEFLRRANAAFPPENKHFSPYKAQALMLYSALGNMVKKFAAIQSSIDLARVACALERYRLVHGEYPEILDVLAPQFMETIPHDIIGGEPLHYRRETNGQFILYSVGWNETDDGGEVVLKKSGSVDQEQGDWVWQYPLK